MPINLNDEHPDDATLEDARMNAATDWEEQFIASLLTRRKQYGGGFRLSDREREIVERIAGQGP
jgi:hypothetical protein